MYFRGGLLLTFAFGMSCVGMVQAYRDGNCGWATFFMIASAIATGLYFWMVKSWLTWSNLMGD